MIHTFKHPSNDYNLTVQGWDKDFFKSNELIGEFKLDLKPLITDASLTKSAVTLNRTYYEEYLKNLKTDHRAWIEFI